MVKNSLTTVIAVLFIFNCMAFDPNSWHLSYAPYGRTITDVQVVDINTILLVGGNETNDAITSLFRSTDRGENWDIILDIPASPWLKAAHFPSGSTGYVVGHGGLIIKTSNGGSSWDTLQLTGNIASRNYNDVFFISDNVGVAVGGNESNDAIQTIIRTTDGGNNWSVVRDNLAGWLNAIYFVNSSVGYASGNEGVILKTMDGGVSWTDLSLSGNLSSRSYNDIQFLDENNGFAVGGFEDNDSIQTIIRTTDGGNNWSVIRDNIGSWLNAIEFSSSNKGIIVGDDGTLLFSEDAGANWSDLVLSASVNEGYHFYCADFMNNNFGVVAGQYGEVMIFESEIPDAPILSLDLATVVSSDSIVLSGAVNPNGSEAQVWFDYGPTLSVANSIAAIPAMVSGTGEIPIGVLLTGLSEGVYYYRLRATNLGGETVSVIRQFYTGPLWSENNFDFEDWNELTFEVLDVWNQVGNVHQTTSYDGSAAVALESSVTDTTAAVILGVVDDNGFFGGLPVSSAPDSIVGYFNYDIAAGTDGFILMVLKSNGSAVDTKTFTYTGTSNNLFERLAFAVDYTGSEAVDTIILGIANNNPFTGIVSFDNYVAVDNVQFVSSSVGPIPNSGFENWSTVSSALPINWYSRDQQEEPFLNNVAFRTTDVQHGAYAIRLENDLQNGRNAYLTSGATDNYGPSVRVGGRHDTFNGFMKFDMQSVVDTVNVSVSMFSGGQNVGWAGLSLFESVTEYTPFSIDISYNDPNVIPDSAQITFQVGTYEWMGTSVLWIDNLSFDGVVAPYVPLGIDELDVHSPQPQITIYPNPSEGIFNISELDQYGYSDIRVIDLSGRLILDQRSNSSAISTIDLSGFASGPYFIRITSLNDVNLFSTHKIIVR